MPITVHCTCGHSLQVSSFLVGKSCKCPECNAWIAVAEAPLPPPPPVPRAITIAALPRPNSTPPNAPPIVRSSETRVVPPVAPPAVQGVPPAPRPPTRTTQPVPRDPFAVPPAPGAKPKTTAGPAAATSEPAVSRVIPPVMRGRTGIVPPAEKPNLFGSAREKPKAGASVIGELRYWLLALALFPLVLSLFRPDDNVRERFTETLKKLPAQERQKLKSGFAGEDDEDDEVPAMDRLFKHLPEGRIEGAYLAHDSHMHWLYALAAAGFYWGIVLLLFPLGNAKASHLLLSGIFTGTIGILLLLGVQWLAFQTFGYWLHGGGILAVIMLVLKVIAWCYHVALDPSAGFVSSLIGFIFGIGLCEEVCKGLVLFYLFRNGSKLDWRGACVWGLASGIGFGVSEGISYAGGMYNGIMLYDIYLIRFISCVALHGIWSAAVGLSAYRHRAELRASRYTILKICIVPMILHGLYDTLLKEQYPGGAVLCAIAGFAWLAYQFECTYAEYGGTPEAVTA